MKTLIKMDLEWKCIINVSIKTKFECLFEDYSAFKDTLDYN